MVRQFFSVKADIKAGKTYHIHGLHLGILMTLRLNFMLSINLRVTLKIEGEGIQLNPIDLKTI